MRLLLGCFVKGRKAPFSVIPAKAGIQKNTPSVIFSGSRLAFRFAELGRDDEMQRGS
jgi:hypothetical protein